MKVQNQKEPSCSDSSLTYLFYNLLPIARRSIGDYPSGSSSGLASWPWLRLPILRTVTSLQPGSTLQRRDRAGIGPASLLSL
nr:MAG TPA: hypothetical protein [Caudoviricetes sp.]